MAYVIGKGTTLSYLSGSYVPVASVTSITPPQVEMGFVETTHLLSAMREHMATINEPGEASFTIEYDPANTTHQFLWDYAGGTHAGQSISWKITMSDSGACDITFSGSIKKFGVSDLGVDKVAMVPCTIQVSGAVVITP